jgi:hypothetical protein
MCKWLAQGVDWHKTSTDRRRSFPSEVIGL